MKKKLRNNAQYMINFIHSKLIFKNKVISVFIQGNHREHMQPCV